MKVVTAPPGRARRGVLQSVFRLLSLAGLVMSAVGAWNLAHTEGTVAAPAPAAPAPSTAPSEAPSPVPSPSTAGEWPTCQSYYLNLQVAYPPDWIVAGEGDQLSCRFFDPEPTTITSDSPLPEAAIRIYISQNTFPKLERSFDPATNADVGSRSEVTLGGHSGFVVEVATPEGGNAYAYVIDLGGDALVLDTFEGFSPDYAQAKSYLDQMAFSLRFLSGDAG